MNLSVRDVAKLFDISEKTVYRWDTDGAASALQGFRPVPVQLFGTSRVVGASGFAPQSRLPPGARESRREGGVDRGGAGRRRRLLPCRERFQGSRPQGDFRLDEAPERNRPRAFRAVPHGQGKAGIDGDRRWDSRPPCSQSLSCSIRKNLPWRYFSWNRRWISRRWTESRSQSSFP